jgi:hypothetical protein
MTFCCVVLMRPWNDFIPASKTECGLSFWNRQIAYKVRERFFMKLRQTTGKIYSANAVRKLIVVAARKFYDNSKS